MTSMLTTEIAKPHCRWMRGINSKFMPLIHRPWGFAISVVSMLVIVFGMLGYFRFKRWI